MSTEFVLYTVGTYLQKQVSFCDTKSGLPDGVRLIRDEKRGCVVLRAYIPSFRRIAFQLGTYNKPRKTPPPSISWFSFNIPFYVTYFDVAI